MAHQAEGRVVGEVHQAPLRGRRQRWPDGRTATHGLGQEVQGKEFPPPPSVLGPLRVPRRHFPGTITIPPPLACRSTTHPEPDPPRVVSETALASMCSIGSWDATFLDTKPMRTQPDCQLMQPHRVKNCFPATKHRPASKSRQKCQKQSEPTKSISTNQ